MKLTYIILILSLFLANCAPVIKPHGYQLEDIVQNEPQKIGISSKIDFMASYGSPSIKIEDISNTWIYISSSKQLKVFSKDEFIDQVIFAFNFDSNDILESINIYDKKEMLDIEYSTSQTYNYGTKYSILDQLYDAFTRGL